MPDKIMNNFIGLLNLLNYFIAFGPIFCTYYFTSILLLRKIWTFILNLSKSPAAFFFSFVFFKLLSLPPLSMASYKVVLSPLVLL